MDLQAMTERAMQIRAQYAQLEERRYGRAWTRQQVMLGFVGDVGDLAKLAMARDGVRAIPDAGAKLAHELGDCLWSLLVLARLYEVDLEEAFVGTMEEIERHLKESAG